MVIQLDNTKPPPNFGIAPFHEISIMTGISKIKISDLRLRHCVVKSARSNEESTALLDGMMVVVMLNICL